MGARETHKTTGFVLRTLSYNESDLIVTFYSHDFGKLQGIAKGAKRSQKRFVNIINHYHTIRQDLEKTLIASYFIDLTDHFSPEGKTNEKLFRLLQDFLIMLSQEKASYCAIRFFEMRLLKLTGFEPTLDHCIICKLPVTNGKSYYFYPRDGGIKCSVCARPEKYDQSISTGTVRTLLLGKDMNIDKIKSISFSDNLAKESRNILTGFISHVLGREVKSLKVMEQVRKLCI
jgi:DNA repair protein RecO (recombination protein O)